MALTQADIQQVLNAIKADSQGIEFTRCDFT